MSTTPASLAFVLAALLATPRAQDPPPPPGGFTVQMQTHRVTWSDGYLTDIDIYWPTAAPPATGWPGVLSMHGGGGHKGTPEMVAIANYLGRRGYAVYLYDARQDGVTQALNPGWATPITDERRLLDSAESHGTARTFVPGSIDGTRLAVTGISLGGLHSKWALAYSGRLLPLTGAVTHYPTVLAVAPEINGLDNIGRQMPGGTIANDEMVESLTSTHPLYSMLALEDYAGASAWVQGTLQSTIEPLLQTSVVPVLSMLAWQDFKGQPNSSIDFMTTMAAGVPRRLLLSSGGHGTPTNIMESNLMHEMRGRWFDRFQKNIWNGVENEAYVEAAFEADAPAYNVLSSIFEHRQETQWPPASPRTTFFLRGGGMLRQQPPAGVEPGAVIPHTVAAGYDFATYQGTSASRDPAPRLFTPGFMSRSTATFVSLPLPADMEVFGRAHVEMHVGDTTGLFQLSVELAHVEPGGTVHPICFGTGGHRSGVAGSQVLAFDLGDIAHAVPAGNTLRVTVLDVADQITPSFRRVRFLPYFTNTTTTVRSSPAAPSRIELPLRPHTTKFAPRLAAVSASAPAGIQAQFAVDGGMARAGQLYVLVVGASGETPPMLVNGSPVPVAYDLITSIGISMLGTQFAPGWIGILDGNGQASAQLLLPPAVSPLLVGFRFTFAGWVTTPALTLEQAFGPATLLVLP